MDKGREEWTAGELREVGFEIPRHIPDCAITGFPYLCNGEVMVDDNDPTLVHFNFVATFPQPFTWAEGTISLDKENQNGQG